MNDLGYEEIEAYWNGSLRLEKVKIRKYKHSYPDHESIDQYYIFINNGWLQVYIKELIFDEKEYIEFFIKKLTKRIEDSKEYLKTEAGYLAKYEEVLKEVIEYVL